MGAEDAAPRVPASGSFGATDAIDIALSFSDGRGILSLEGRPVGDVARLEALELEIPNLSFPFDASGGAWRFQRRRCLLRRATLSADLARLEEALRRGVAAGG